MDIKDALTLDGLKYFYTKYIKPLKTGAFATVVNNATTTATNTVLDGRMGKTLADKDANLQSQINTLNSTLAEKTTRFHTYDITDSQETDYEIKQVVDYYIEHNVEECIMFIMRITLTKGSTYTVYGYKHNEGYATAIVTNYFLDIPLYGRRKKGEWTWGNISVT